MIPGVMIFGSGVEEAERQIKAGDARVRSQQMVLTKDEWQECFGGKTQNKEKAMEYSRQHFKKLYPEHTQLIGERNG